jgi:hypothetical protein
VLALSIVLRRVKASLVERLVNEEAVIASYVRGAYSTEHGNMIQAMRENGLLRK